MAEYNYDKIMQELCQRLEALTNSEQLIEPETNLISQLSIDSIKLLNLVMEIEDTFDISVPVNALADVQTVRNLADLIHKIKSEA